MSERPDAPRRRARLLMAAALGLVALAALAPASRDLQARSPTPEIVVYKSPTCGCCSLWVDHLRANGFRVAARDVADIDAVRRQAGVPARLGSCHTATVGGYVIEGHVPAADIRRLLEERPRLDGLAVPGMPFGSPDMEMGARVDPYDVLAFNRAGETRVYSRYPAGRMR